MADASSERRKRSKWDDPRAPARDAHREERDRDRDHGRDRERDRNHSSRWDARRSRSPARRRSRSPPTRDSATPVAEARKAIDPAAAAAAAAAKINATIQAKRGIQHVDVPPIRGSTGTSSSPPATTGFNSEMYIADGDYIKDIEVNDLRNRYTLTKGATQKMIKEETGADVTTRGAYYPDKSMATPQGSIYVPVGCIKLIYLKNPPLYLHITSTTKEGLEKAVAKIEELMKQELPNLVDERRFRRRDPPEPVERDEYGRRKWPEEKVPVGLDPIPGFNLRASVVGHGGAYVKHIQQETRCRVQIKGRGSGFRENHTDMESDEPLHLHITGPDINEVQRAKELCEDLVASVKQQYEEHKNQPQPVRFPGYGAGGQNTYVPAMPAVSSASPPPPPPPAAQAPPPPPGTGTPGAAPGTAPGVDAASAYTANPYAAYYGADPYAAYGGYAAYMQMYSAYYGTTAMSSATATPAPPGSTGASPPPPGAGSYSAVRPPPGM